MSHLAHSKSLLLNPDRNQMLRWLLKKTFYAQFCAGENSKEVRTTINELRGLGFGGVILSYAKEVVLDHGTAKTLDHTDFILNEQDALRAVELWRNATLETVRMTGNGDFVALKLTGAGPQAMHHLTHSLPPPPSLEKAIVDICDLASARGVKLLFDAEQQAVQSGIDAWTLNFMRRYNGHTTTVYGTYQAYLKSCATTVAEHLSVARREHFNLGVKLVRGAYLASDPRHLIHDDKVATDATFDGISEALIRRSFNDVLLPAAGETTSIFPPVSIVLASHNHPSVDKAQKILESNHVAGKPPTDIVYAQLQGMADEVSCALLQAGSDSGLRKHNDAPRVYKYLTWGTTGECMKYLLRRAEENRDAVARTKDGRDALATELWRRIRLSVGLGV
ncbi:MAG: hypothetical protein M1825_000716 [Sarcosagium campestre]|nr:MAG: hypothetical protein M1825_000716 [Sarcosagium campestre]